MLNFFNGQRNLMDSKRLLIGIKIWHFSIHGRNDRCTAVDDTFKKSIPVSVFIRDVCDILFFIFLKIVYLLLHAFA